MTHFQFSFREFNSGARARTRADVRVLEHLAMKGTRSEKWNGELADQGEMARPGLRHARVPSLRLRVEEHPSLPPRSSAARCADQSICDDRRRFGCTRVQGS